MKPILVVACTVLTDEEREEIEAAGYIVLDVLHVGDAAVLNGPALVRVFPSRWQRFLSVFR